MMWFKTKTHFLKIAIAYETHVYIKYFLCMVMADSTWSNALDDDFEDDDIQLVKVEKKSIFSKSKPKKVDCSLDDRLNENLKKNPETLSSKRVSSVITFVSVVCPWTSYRSRDRQTSDTKTWHSFKKCYEVRGRRIKGPWYCCSLALCLLLFQVSGFLGFS